MVEAVIVAVEMEAAAVAVEEEVEGVAVEEEEVETGRRSRRKLTW